VQELWTCGISRIIDSTLAVDSVIVLKNEVKKIEHFRLICSYFNTDLKTSEPLKTLVMLVICYDLCLANRFITHYLIVLTGLA